MRLKNEKGIALILVISSVLFLTSLVFDFWQDAQMGHQLAINYQYRVQAYYLAKSGNNFSRMVIYFNKKVEGILNKSKVSMSDIGFQPLYKQIPISSEGLRGMMAIAAAKGASGGGGDDDGGGSDDATKGVSMLSQKDIESFLDFDGNFDAAVSEEQSKYSLNAISKMTPTSTAYDLHKKVLLSMLMKPSYKNFFENQDYDAPDLVHAIADFADSNNVVNEFNKAERGSEDSKYKGDFKSKNAPYLTVSELRLVPGMSDDIYEAIKPMVTVYHTSEKVNICLAETGIVDALIVHFTNYSECTTPLDPEDDKDEIEKIRSEILSGCPDTGSVGTLFNTALALDTSTKPEDGGCKIKFTDLITGTNNIFRIESTGEVNGVLTKVIEVIDSSGSKASSWKTLFYQID